MDVERAPLMGHFDIEDPNPPPSTAISHDNSASYFTTLEKISFVGALEGLRGYAVILVMMAHVAPGKDILGPLGVGIFFVLSGFLITGVLSASIEKTSPQSHHSDGHKDDRIQWRISHLPRFYLDRFVRLTPALFIMVAIMTQVCLHLGVPREYILPDALSALFYVHNNLPTLETDKRLMRPGMFLNTWSLAVEEQFYIFWSLAMPFLLQSSIRIRTVSLLAMTSLSFLIRYYAGYAFLSSYMYGLDFRYAWSSNVWKMFMGCAARLLPIPKICLDKKTGIASTLALFVLTYIWGWGLQESFDFRTQGPWLELVTSIIVLQVIIGSLQDDGNFILNWQVFRFTGQVSYAWYLWQFPLQALHAWPVGNWGPTGIAFVVATFSTFVVENPLRSLYRKLLPHSPQKQPAQVVVVENSKTYED